MKLVLISAQHKIKNNIPPDLNHFKSMLNYHTKLAKFTGIDFLHCAMKQNKSLMSVLVTMNLPKPLKQAIYRHAQDCYPNKCCGIIADGEFLPCANIAPNPANFFEIDGEWLFDMLQIYEDDIIIVHSHPNGTPDLSEYDKVQMDLHGLDWLVVAVSNDIQDGWQFSHQHHIYQEHTPPLLGRGYVGGVQDTALPVFDDEKVFIEK